MTDKVKVCKFSTKEVATQASIDPEKTDYKQIVYAEVYAPFRPDSEGDYMTADDIEVMAHNFIADNNSKQIDLYHDNVLVEGAAVVESFIARAGDPTYIEGAWVVGVRILNKDVWASVLDGTLNGFSVEAWATLEPTEVTLLVPENITGHTTIDEGHSHKFVAHYDDQGVFLGGVTDMVQGHIHKITVGSVTSYASADKGITHRHRFSAVDNLEIIEESPEK